MNLQHTSNTIAVVASTSSPGLLYDILENFKGPSSPVAIGATDEELLFARKTGISLKNEV